MPTVRFRGREFECEEGAILRDVLLDADETPYNGAARYLNCRGKAACGTCAVEVDGAVSDPEPKETRRLSKPPHEPDSDLRLACRTRVLGDVEVRKRAGFWGRKA
ncbi:2Fe-2S iron-sulfur cluster-binding protein [Haladaptatus salinisoli]|uniref:2Fe-2S iron-sulfur cluster-binding protein n=1 Tax=Haladaptatus salinisoli TaxID=2884876 RepID=UPI001D0A57A9|nr:2Fe-2S iron-sulfur cluster-binding protein [Haladaptatus salinisoli]